MAYTQGGYGPGTFVDKSYTPVPEECRRLLKEFAAKTPGFTKDTALLDGVKFEGDELPCIPGPIKSQAVTAVLHAMAGIVGHEILHSRGIETNNITHINTNHAGLYPATPALATVDGVSGEAVPKMKTVPQWDRREIENPLMIRSLAIYPTGTEGVWYQIHGSTQPRLVLRVLGLDTEDKPPSNDAAYERIKQRTLSYSARDLEHLMLDHGLAGSIVHSPESWLSTMMGKALARPPLVNYSEQTQCPPTPPIASPASAGAKPLAGIKVLELGRIIAAPAGGAALASFGAEVIRVNTDKLMDYTQSQISSLMAGKTTLKLDLTEPNDHKRLTELFDNADVIVQGYRLRSLERHGFGLNKALEMAARRGRGVVYLDENCYGLEGYYAERPGWQQVADAAAGSSYVMGQSAGKPAGQGILPSLPISDMSTGILTALIIMCGIRDRARQGGSYHGNASLTKYNMATLWPEVRLYQPEIVEKIKQKYRFPSWDSDEFVAPLYYAIMRAWDNNSDLIKDERYYVHFRDGPYGKDHRVLGPIVRYDDASSTPRWTSPPVPFCHHEFRHFGEPGH